jgi:Ankyrin repeats (3 copies)
MCLEGKTLDNIYICFCTLWLIRYLTHQTNSNTVIILDFVQTYRLLEAGCPWDAASVSHAATSSGSVELVQYLKQQKGIAVGATAMQAAAAQGHTAVCKYLHSAGMQPLLTVTCILSVTMDRLLVRAICTFM